MHKEKKKLIIEMIGEYKEVERHIEEQIFQLQTRLDMNRHRRVILQDFLEKEENSERME